ncbi:MAG: MarR family transcriptional regulator [Dehalococcoidia bacterium]|nr:MarR family transcriptional regulator [Dehalococcoidia bacterium]
MERDRENLVEGILGLADGLFRKLLPTVPRDLLTLDVTMPQIKILLILYVGGPRRMSDIAADLDVTLPTATSLVERLVEKQYVTRETRPDDRRVVLCHLSPEGEQAINHIWQSARTRSCELLQTLDTSKLQMLWEALDAMLNRDTTEEPPASCA